MQVGLDLLTSAICKSPLQFQPTNIYQLLYLTSSTFHAGVGVLANTFLLLIILYLLVIESYHTEFLTGTIQLDASINIETYGGEDAYISRYMCSNCLLSNFFTK